MYNNRAKVIEFIQDIYNPESGHAFAKAIEQGDDKFVTDALKIALDPLNWTGGTLAQREAAKTMLKELDGHYLG